MPSDHDWELKGGATGHSGEPSIPTGLSLWQCRDCGLSASRHLTFKQTGHLNSVLDPPDVEQDCPAGGESDAE